MRVRSIPVRSHSQVTALVRGLQHTAVLIATGDVVDQVGRRLSSTIEHSMLWALALPWVSELIHPFLHEAAMNSHRLTKCYNGRVANLDIRIGCTALTH